MVLSKSAETNWILPCCPLTHRTTCSHTQVEWHRFRRHYRRAYHNATEETHRLEVFQVRNALDPPPQPSPRRRLSNFDRSHDTTRVHSPPKQTSFYRALARNAANVRAGGQRVFGVTPFSDETQHEFDRRYKGRKGHVRSVGVYLCTNIIHVNICLCLMIVLRQSFAFLDHSIDPNTHSKHRAAASDGSRGSASPCPSSRLPWPVTSTGGWGAPRPWTGRARPPRPSQIRDNAGACG